MAKAKVETCLLVKPLEAIPTERREPDIKFFVNYNLFMGVYQKRASLTMERG